MGKIDNGSWQTGTFQNLPAGTHIGFRNYGTDLKIDYIYVRKYASIEPSLSFGSNGMYSTNNPSIQPNTTKSFVSLSSFSESATKNGGEIKYQISNKHSWNVGN